MTRMLPSATPAIEKRAEEVRRAYETRKALLDHLPQPWKALAHVYLAGYRGVMHLSVRWSRLLWMLPPYRVEQFRQQEAAIMSTMVPKAMYDALRAENERLERKVACDAHEFCLDSDNARKMRAEINQQLAAAQRRAEALDRVLERLCPMIYATRGEQSRLDFISNTEYLAMVTLRHSGKTAVETVLGALFGQAPAEDAAGKGERDGE